MEQMPRPGDTDGGVYTSRLLKSINRVVKEKLSICDPSGQQTFDSPTWVEGWEVPLYNAMHKIIPTKSSTDTSISQAVDSFQKIDHGHAVGTQGPALL